MRLFSPFGLFSLLICIALLTPHPTQAQAGAKRYTLSGTVRDAKSGEVLPGLNVFVTNKAQGVLSNSYGYYAIALPPDSLVLRFSYIGYKTQERKLYLGADIQLNIEMEEETATLQEVVITDKAKNDAVQQTQMSSTQINAATIKRVPALFGEVDPLKVLQFLPGIKVGSEATAGFYVRGGGGDQNLILLDEAVVYNANHVGGLFSIFNPDAVKGLEVYKGNFPARYGGRLSSVLDVQLKEGNRKHWAFAGGIGIISSRFTAEGPIVKDKGSFVISARRTYIDVFTSAINRSRRNDPNFNPIPDYYFYDLNLKANYDLGPNDRIFLSGYFGRDVFGFRSGGNNFGFDFNWGNTTTTLRWNHIFGERLFANTTLTFSDFNYRIDNRIASFSLGLYSRIQNYNAKIDFDWYPVAKHNVKFGGQYTYHVFTPSGFDSENPTTGLATSFQQQLYGTELAAFVSDDYDVTSRLRVNMGLRVSGFLLRTKTYSGLEPRLAARYKLNENLSIKASYARMFQYIHLATPSTASLPTDVWYPSTELARPQYSDQIAAGVTGFLPSLGITITNEVYYKWLWNQVDLKQNAQFFGRANIDEEFVFGRGYSYGNELLIEKKEGRLTGWIGYTWSRTMRQFDSLNVRDVSQPYSPENLGREFPFKFDRTHDLSLVAMYDISKRAAITLTFVYRTGEAVTIANSRFQFNDVPGVYRVGLVGGQPYIGQSTVLYPERNNYRMPDFHRMDVSFTWRFKPKKRWQSELNISIYNLYSRRNAFALYLDEVKNDNGVTQRFEYKTIALFPLIPSLTYNFKF